VAGFKFGPGLGLLLTAVVAVLFALITGQGGPWGVLMHFLATGSYVAVAGFIYQRRRTQNGAIISLIVAPLFMTVIMAGANLLVTPLYMGVGREVVKGMLLPAIIPFNLLKGVINGAITLLVYKRISNFIEEPLYKRGKATTRVRS
jgi:riboflavin transporter FmnP